MGLEKTYWSVPMTPELLPISKPNIIPAMAAKPPIIYKGVALAWSATLKGSASFLPYIDVIRYPFCPVHHERAKRLKQDAKKQGIRQHKFIYPGKDQRRFAYIIRSRCHLFKWKWPFNFPMHRKRGSLTLIRWEIWMTCHRGGSSCTNTKHKKLLGSLVNCNEAPGSIYEYCCYFIESYSRSIGWCCHKSKRNWDKNYWICW